MGVAFYWRDGRADYAIFDVYELAEEVKNPKPKQLELFPEGAE